MNTQPIAEIFADTEDKAKELADTFREFIKYIPLPEGTLRIDFKPEFLNCEGLVYKATLVWDMGERLGGSTLFRVYFNPEYGLPLSTACLDTLTIPKDGDLQSGLETLAGEVKAKLQALVALREAGNLYPKNLGRKPDAPEPTLMIQTG
jgi:hypothetical protein